VSGRLATFHIFQDAKQGLRFSSAVDTTNEFPIPAIQITMLAIPLTVQEDICEK